MAQLNFSIGGVSAAAADVNLPNAELHYRTPPKSPNAQLHIGVGGASTQAENQSPVTAAHTSVTANDPEMLRAADRENGKGDAETLSNRIVVVAGVIFVLCIVTPLLCMVVPLVCLGGAMTAAGAAVSGGPSKAKPLQSADVDADRYGLFDKGCFFVDGWAEVKDETDCNAARESAIVTAPPRCRRLHVGSHLQLTTSDRNEQKTRLPNCLRLEQKNC